MDTIEKIIGLVILSGLFLTLVFIISDLGKLAYKEAGGFKKYVFNRVKKMF